MSMGMVMSMGMAVRAGSFVEGPRCDLAIVMSGTVALLLAARGTSCSPLQRQHNGTEKDDGPK